MKLLLSIFCLFLLVGCTNEESNIKMDHFNIWVENPEVAKKKLVDIGFTTIPDSLCQVHTGQGTTGRYFYFLNGYLELIFVNDTAEFLENAMLNNSLDFVERSQNLENGYAPFSIALQMKDYNKDEILFKKIEYAQEWMGETNRIYVAQNSKKNKTEPSLFLIYPEIQYDKFESMDSLSKIPEEYAMWRTFYKHKNGAETISKIKFFTKELNKNSETIKLMNGLNTVEVKEGEEYLMEIYFDNQKQNKSFDLRPEIPLKIYL